MTQNQTPNPVDLYQKTTSRVKEVVAEVRQEQLQDATPCTEWNVGSLLRHLIGGQEFTAGLLKGSPPAGLTYGAAATANPIDADIGKLSQAYLGGLDAVVQAAQDPASLTRTIQTPAGEMTGAEFIVAATMDQLLHGWDLAKATRQDAALDPGLVEMVYNFFVPAGVFDRAREAGVIGPKVSVPEDADLQSKLLGEAGRKP